MMNQMNVFGKNIKIYFYKMEKMTKKRDRSNEERFTLKGCNTRGCVDTPIKTIEIDGEEIKLCKFCYKAFQRRNEMKKKNWRTIA